MRALFATYCPLSAIRFLPGRPATQPRLTQVYLPPGLGRRDQSPAADGRWGHHAPAAGAYPPANFVTESSVGRSDQSPARSPELSVPMSWTSLLPLATAIVLLPGYGTGYS